MAKLYGDVFKGDGDNERERIEKARKEVDELARERVRDGLEDTMAEARVAVYKAHPDLTSSLWDAPPPEPEQEDEPDTRRREIENEVMKRAAVLSEKTGVSLAQAAIRVLATDSDLSTQYFEN